MKRGSLGNIRLSPRAKMLFVPIFFFSLAGILCSGGLSFDWANVVWRLFHNERSLHAYWFSAVIAGRYDLPSYERAFSLTSYETESSSLQLSKGFRLFDFLQSFSWIWIIINDFSFVRECDGFLQSFVTLGLARLCFYQDVNSHG